MRKIFPQVLKSTGQTVKLCLERYLRGPKFEQLQQAIAASELKPPTPSSPSAASLPRFPVSTVSIMMMAQNNQFSGFFLM